MRPLRWLLTCAVVAAAGVGAASPDCPAADPPGTVAEGPTPPRAVGDSPINIFLSTPADLDAFLRRLGQPDFVLMSGDELRKEIERARQETPTGPRAAVVRSIAIRGEVAGDLAALDLQLEVSVLVSGPAWVALGLDNQVVSEAREGEKDLALRRVAGGWQVELLGGGEHRVRVRVKVPLRATSEGRRLELAIPEAPATAVEIDVDRPVAVAVAGPDEPLDRVAIPGGKGTRLSGHLSPRARLGLTWRIETDPAAQLPPLLSIQGEIAIDVDPGSFRTRSSWAIKAVRGESRVLEVGLDPGDEVLDLSLDGQPVPAGVEGATRLTIPLIEPLRPGTTKHLVMTTRRVLPPQPSARLAFHGFPLGNAKEQSGAVGIAQGENLWVNGIIGRGVRQIDPRTELPPDLRARPSTVLAYQFFGQPFELNLHIEPLPPLVRTDARTTIVLDPRQARVDTRLRAETAHGRLFELAVMFPRELELESVGPNEIVEAWQVSPEAGGARLLKARLTSRAQGETSFELHLIGRQAIDPARPVALGLFQPRNTLSGGGRIAVLAGPSLTVEWPDHDDVQAGRDAFRPALLEPPADWPWPPSRLKAAAPALWLRHDGKPSSLPLRVAVHSRTIALETRLDVQVGGREIETRQESTLTVHFGTLDHIEVEVPRPLEGRWELEDGDAEVAADLGPSPSGGRLVRLKLAEEATDTVRLSFRLRQPTAALTPDAPRDVDVSWLRLRATNAAPIRAKVRSGPGVRLKVLAPGWVRSPVDDASEGEGDLSSRFTLASAGGEAEAPPLPLGASALALTDLPSLVASRLWLRTVQGPESDLLTTAWYRVETHDSEFSVALPAGAEWIRARVGGEPVSQVEPLPKSAGYRFAFPAQAASSPVLVTLEYLVHATDASATWRPPRLINGAVGETLWEVRVPSSRALVGVPPGWTDENQWYWDRFVWKRRPWKTAAALAAWAGAPATHPRAGDDFEDDARGDEHGYMFGRPGPPVPILPWIASRAGLVALCSGPVLALGFLILYLQPPIRPVGTVLLALVLAVATAVQPSVTLLAVQASMIGVVFTLLAAAMQRLVERPRRAASAIFGEPNTLSTTPLPDSSVSRSAGAGSDDPTAIRGRPASTVDHAPTSIPQASDVGPGRLAPRERG